MRTFKNRFSFEHFKREKKKCAKDTRARSQRNYTQPVLPDHQRNTSRHESPRGCVIARPPQAECRAWSARVDGKKCSRGLSPVQPPLAGEIADFWFSNFGDSPNMFKSHIPLMMREKNGSPFQKAPCKCIR